MAVALMVVPVENAFYWKSVGARGRANDRRPLVVGSGNRGLSRGQKRDTVYKWIERKAMPAHKVGRLWKFRKDEVDQWGRHGGASEG